MCMADSSPSLSLYPDGAVILAPLSDYTDYPFRQACRRVGCRLAFTPLIDVGSLVYNRPANRHLLYRGADEPWLGVQILGANPRFFETAVKMLNDESFDVLDLNLGCPMPKVTKRGAGAALGSDLPAALMCLEMMTRFSRFPVTAKMRVLSAEDPEPTVKFALALQEAGVQALTVHGRLWQMIYSGPVAFSVLRAVREALRIPVIANGGVFDAASAEELRRETGCTRVMVARGAIGNPWIFRELAATAGAAKPSAMELCDTIATHVSGMVDFYGENQGLRCARKIMHGYLHGRGYRHTLKEQVSHLATVTAFADFMGRLREEIPAETARLAEEPL